MVWNVEMSVLGPSCVKTRNFPDLGGPSPLAHTEIVEYRRSSEAKFLEQNFIRSFHTASAECRQVGSRPKAAIPSKHSCGVGRPAPMRDTLDTVKTARPMLSRAMKSGQLFRPQCKLVAKVN
jgi:hypothetical protein